MREFSLGQFFKYFGPLAGSGCGAKGSAVASGSK